MKLITLAIFSILLVGALARPPSVEAEELKEALQSLGSEESDDGSAEDDRLEDESPLGLLDHGPLGDGPDHGPLGDGPDHGPLGDGPEHGRPGHRPGKKHPKPHCHPGPHGPPGPPPEPSTTAVPEPSSTSLEETSSPAG